MTLPDLTSITTFFSSLMFKIILAALAVAMVFGAGYYTCHMGELQQENVDLRDVRAVDGGAVQVMQGVEKKLQTAIGETAGVTGAVTLAITFINPVAKSELNGTNPTTGAAVQCSANPHLSAGIVGVLNAARQGIAPPSTAWLDGEGQATSFTRLTDLASSDAVVAGMYHELALRHDTLVDFVAAKQKEQQDRLKAAR